MEMKIDTLFAAAIASTDARVKLEKEADILDSYGENILHIESERGIVKHVQYILTEFANKNLLFKVDHKKETALHLAAENGHTEVVKILIDAARCVASSSANDISYDNEESSLNTFVWRTNQYQNTALHLAVNNGNLGSAKLLAEASPMFGGQRTVNQLGETPIYLAVKLGHYDIVKTMITAWKDCIPLNGPDDWTTVLHAAIINLHKAKEKDRNVVVELIRAFKPNDYDFHFHPLSGMSIEIPYSRFEALFDHIDKNYETILSLAVGDNHIDVVEQIINIDPAFNYGRVRKNSDLKSLRSLAEENGYTDMVKLLSRTYEARYHIGHTGQTDLHIAITKRDEESVLGLLKAARQVHLAEDDNSQVHLGEAEDHRVDLGEADDHRWTPLHYAAYYEFDSILEATHSLYRVDQAEYESRRVPTPLYVAAKEGHTSTLKKLMELLPPSLYGVDDFRTQQNILHVAVIQSNREMIQHILIKCPENYIVKLLNHQDVNGDTPLHLLIRNGCFVPQLIKHKKIERMVKNKQNWTSFDMLYFKDKIVGDQVKIKKALDDLETDHHRNFWPRSIKKKSIMLESSVPPSKRTTKDRKFIIASKLMKEEKLILMKDELDRYRQRTNTQIIVTALITTVTFTVGFTMPGGYHQDGDQKGMALLSNKKAFIAFMVFDALALLLSTSSLFLYFIASMYEDPHSVSKLIGASTVLNIVSVIAMMLTFITGTYVVLSHSRVLAITVIVISCSFFLLVIGGLFIKWRYDRKQEKMHEV